MTVLRKKEDPLEVTGFEPVAYRMQSDRSTTELNPHRDLRFFVEFWIYVPLLSEAVGVWGLGALVASAHNPCAEQLVGPASLSIQTIQLQAQLCRSVCAALCERTPLAATDTREKRSGLHCALAPTVPACVQRWAALVHPLAIR
jgi:hypothetical protein